MQRFRRVALLAGTLAGIGLLPGAAAAEPGVGEGVVGDPVMPVILFDREVHAMLLPQLREPDAAAASRRPPKATTLLQLDAQVGEESDVLFRVQAKQKQFLYLEFRF